MAAEKTLDEKRRRQQNNTLESQVPPTNDEIDDDEDDVEEDAAAVDARSITQKKGRATPGRRKRTQEEQAAEGNVITRSVGGIGDYFSEVLTEIKKVSWPTRAEVISLTRIVLAVTVASALILGGLSLLAGQVIRLGLEIPALMAVIFLAITGATVVYIRRSNTSRSSY